MPEKLQPGQVLARGLCRHLRQHNFMSLTEFVPRSGLRVDAIAIGPKGEIWIVECKSSRADFMSDHKWEGYLEWCDRYFWCVDCNFPTEILPKNEGLIIADGFGAEIINYGPEAKLNPARRKAVTKQVARVAMNRLQGLIDPSPSLQFDMLNEA